MYWRTDTTLCWKLVIALYKSRRIAPVDYRYHDVKVKLEQLHDKSANVT